jgi:uncharacterized protein (TIGR03086 family)
MSDFLNLYLDKADRFGSVVRKVPSDGWSAQSPCAKWTAADVVDHVVDSQRDFFPRHDLDLGPRPTGTPSEVWQRHLDAARKALGDGAVLNRTFDGFFGPTTIGATLVSFYALDLVVHRWDLARAAGTDTEFSEDEMNLLDNGIALFGEHMYDEGVFAAAVPAPPEATRQERLLAVMGRNPR